MIAKLAPLSNQMDGWTHIDGQVESAYLYANGADEDYEVSLTPEESLAMKRILGTEEPHGPVWFYSDVYEDLGK